MVQQVKWLAMQTWQPELDAQNSCKGARRELTTHNCPLTSIYTPWYTHTHAHTYACIHTYKYNLHTDDFEKECELGGGSTHL